MSVQDTSHSSIDLHVHSTASDGLLSPSDVVNLAASLGITTLALTDHDTTQGVDEAYAAGVACGVEVIPSIELSTSVDDGELHLLGYFIDHRSPVLQASLSKFREARRSRVIRIVERLNQIGVNLELACVQAQAGAGSIGRAHVARAMVEAGLATSVDDAFTRYLSRGRPAYIPRLRLSPIDAVRLIQVAGGAAVLAHPFTVPDLERVLPELVLAGLAGLEVYYSLYNTEQREHLAEIARRFGLVSTGGSDFHGSREREGYGIGTAPVPLDTAERLRETRIQAR